MATTAPTAPAHLPETSLWANRKCLMICGIVAIANTQYGLDSAAVASLQAMPGTPSGTFQQLIGSLLTLGAFISSLVAGAFAHFFGRKVALWLACGLNFIGCAIQIATTDKGVVYLGRLILGVGNGFLVTFSNIYTAEAAPAHLRAVIVALLRNRLDKASYQIPLGTLFIVPAILAVGLFFVPESPRYLLNKGREGAAHKALESLRGDSLRPEELELEWVEMVKGIGEEKRLTHTVGPLDMYRGTDLRRTLLCYGVIATQTAAGSWFVISYATYFMTVSGLAVEEAFRYSVMNTCIGFIGVNFGIYAMRYLVGRRSILMIGAVAQGAAMLGMAIAATVGSTISLGYVLAWLTGFCSPYFISPSNLNWGAKYGYIGAGSNLV